MTEGQPPRPGDHAAAAPPVPARDVRPVTEIRMVAPLAEDDDAEGGDPVCWAHLVCDECGAITAEGHRAGCPRTA
jgi:hypothetical protein